MSEEQTDTPPVKEEQKAEVKITLSEDEVKQLNADIEKAKTEIGVMSKEQLDAAKTEGKTEAEKEAQLNQKLADMEKAKTELENKLVEQEKKATEQIEKVQENLNKLVESKQVVAKNPFETEVALSAKVDKLTNDELTNIEEKSARDFFGADYDNRM